MFKFSAVAAALFFVAGCEKQGTAPASTAPAAISIGVLPNEGSKDLDLFKNALSKRIGMPVSIVVPKDYSDLLTRFSKGEVDFAFFTALLFLQAEREAAAKALLKKVYGTSDFYYSAIIVRSDSPIKSLKDLKGKKFGFVDPKSTSGYLYPRVLLRAAGLDAGEGVSAGGNSIASDFFGTHENSVQALLDKKVDAAGVWADEPATGTGVWNAGKFESLKGKPFRILAISDPIPNDAFAVREDYYVKQGPVVLKVMEALIGLGEENDSVLKKVFGVDKMATATSRHYDSVRALEPLLKGASR